MASITSTVSNVVKRALLRIGLVTAREASVSYHAAYARGYQAAMHDVMDEMQRIYRTPAAEWAEHMYGYVADRKE